MQTFLPHVNFIESAECLDNKRLGKQRVEAWQIYQALTIGSRWKNHPAVLMWKNFEGYLLLYGYTICREWTKRGFKDAMTDRFTRELYAAKEMNAPNWLGKQSFHSAHRSILLAKNYDWYRRFQWKENPAVRNEQNRWPYEWPKIIEKSY